VETATPRRSHRATFESILHRRGQRTNTRVSPSRYRLRIRSRVFSESTSESRRTSTWTIRDPFVATRSGRIRADDRARNRAWELELVDLSPEPPGSSTA